MRKHVSLTQPRIEHLHGNKEILYAASLNGQSHVQLVGTEATLLLPATHRRWCHSIEILRGRSVAFSRGSRAARGLKLVMLDCTRTIFIYLFIIIFLKTPSICSSNGNLSSFIQFIGGTPVET